MLGCPMMELSEIWIWTSTPCGSRLLWSQFSVWHLKAPPCRSGIARDRGGELCHSARIGRQPSRRTFCRWPVEPSVEVSSKWSSSIDKWQPPSSRQRCTSRITQNHRMREYIHDRDDLCNIIDDRRCLRVKSPTPPWRSPARDITPLGRGSFCALAPSLRQVV
jgi:hypothetical protein